MPEHRVFESSVGWYFLHPVTHEYHGPFDSYDDGHQAYQKIRTRQQNEIDSPFEESAYSIMSRLFDKALKT